MPFIVFSRPSFRPFAAKKWSLCHSKVVKKNLKKLMLWFFGMTWVTLISAIIMRFPVPREPSKDQGKNLLANVDFW